MDTWSTSVPGCFWMVPVLHALGNWTLRYEPLVSGTSCSLFGVGAMLGSTVDTCSAYSGWLLEEFIRIST